MAGSAITITDNSAEVAKAIGKVEERFGSNQPAMEIIGATIQASVQRNFEKGGRPGWVALAPATLKKKKGGSILRVKGMAGGLMGSIHYEVSPNQVMIGTNKIYGAIHQLGGKAGRGRKVKIPARPYLVVQDEDWPEIINQLGEFVLTGKT